jgi:transaldolase
MRGIERRIEAGLDPDVASVASVFMSRLDTAVLGRAPEDLRGRLALAVGLETYQAYRRLMDSNRWQRLANAGARVQRLLWASTSTKDPSLPDTLYVDGLSAPHTINTMPESTLLAVADHGHIGAPMRADGGDAQATLAQFESVGIDVDAVAATLQTNGAKNFVESWNDLMSRIDDQVAVVAHDRAA